MRMDPFSWRRGTASAALSILDHVATGPFGCRRLVALSTKVHGSNMRLGNAKTPLWPKDEDRRGGAVFVCVGAGVTLQAGGVVHVAPLTAVVVPLTGVHVLIRAVHLSFWFGERPTDVLGKTDASELHLLLRLPQWTPGRGQKNGWNAY
ncbi:hypothetical protein Ae201684P_022412 [Aphanomyces euteiches]|nr:hypothetical protein Ae201684P_022412 [Aphanomyces euteiches]